MANQTASKRLTTAAAGEPQGVTLLEDHRQKRRFPTTLGGGATTVEIVPQVVECRGSNSFWFCSAGLEPGTASECRPEGRRYGKLSDWGNALFVEVQPPDFPEVRIWETGDDLQTDPLTLAGAGEASRSFSARTPPHHSLAIPKG